RISAAGSDRPRVWIDVLRPSRAAANRQAWSCAIGAEPLELLLVELDAEAGARRHHDMPVTHVDRPDQDVLGDHVVGADLEVADEQGPGPGRRQMGGRSDADA